MAEEIKLKIGSAAPYDGEGAMEVRGRNLTDGLPGAMEITSGITGFSFIKVSFIVFALLL